MTDDRASNFQKAYGMNAFIKEQAFRNLYGGNDVWSFNPYREVDEIAEEDSEYTEAELDWEDYTDADAQLDNDYRDYIDDEVE